MSRYLSLIFLFFLTIFKVAAQQSGNINGTVTTSDGQPSYGVTIGIRGSGIGTSTNQKGHFHLTRLRAGTYILKVSLIGLIPEEKTISLEAGKSLNVDFILKENASQLKEVTISASRHKYKVDAPSSSMRLNEPLLLVPQNIQVITSDQIRDQQIFDMMEGVSRNVSGVTMQEHWGNYAHMNTRGDRVAPFRNGMNVESDWGPLSEDMSFVDRIEFVKGPAGFMLANGNPAGFYNVVTKKPTGSAHQSVDITLGSFNNYRVTADLDGVLTKDGKLQYRLNVMGELRDSWRKFDYNNRYGLAPVLKYQFNANNSLTAEYTYQFSREAVLGSAYLFSLKKYTDLPASATSADPNMPPTNMQDHSAFLTYEHKFNDKWKLTAQAAYIHYNQVGSDIWLDSIRGNGNEYRSYFSWDAVSTMKMGQVFINGEAKTGSIHHRILGGLDLGDKYYIADYNQYFPLDATTPFTIYNPVYGKTVIPVIDRSKPLSERGAGNRMSEQYGALYLQDELGFFRDKLRLTLAARYTRSRTISVPDTIKANKFTPRVGLSYSIDKSTSVYALLDQSFLPQSGVIFGGGAVKPVTGNDLEAGLKRDWFGGKWSSSITVYRILKNNQLIADPDRPNTIFQVQLGQTKTHGVEFDARGEIISGLNLMVNYAWTDSRISKDAVPSNVGQSVPGFAKQVTNAWLSYRISQGPLKRLGFSLGYQWQLQRLPWDFTQGDKSDLPAYFRLDGAVSYQLKRMSFALNVNNLLNAYLYSGGHENYLGKPGQTVYTWQAEAPVNARLSIGYRF